MAVTAITPEVLTLNTFDSSSLAVTAATSATDGFLVSADYEDKKLLLIFTNTDDTLDYDVTIKKGNALQGTADLKLTDLGAGATATIVVESGLFKNVTGKDIKGKIVVIPENVKVKMAAIVLP